MVIRNRHLLHSRRSIIPLNLLSCIYARIYFPTYSNGLKEIAKYLGFSWADTNAAGIQTIIWRMNWERSREVFLKQKLITYNADDCEALNHVTEFINRITEPKIDTTANEVTDVVKADSLPREGFWKFRKNQFCLTALEEINRTAYWDYQHEKILLRSNKRLKKIAKATNRRRKAKIKVNKIIRWPSAPSCPECGGIKLYRHQKYSRDIFDIRFGKSSVKRWVTHHVYYRYKCTACGKVFFNIDRSLRGSKYGPNLIALVTYLIIEMRIPQTRVTAFVNKIFGFNLSKETISNFKAKIATTYQSTYESILQKISIGRLVHADETKINLDGKTGYVWAFTNMENVAYVFSPSREGDLVQAFLKDFKGVLITDFFGAYESLNCPQQKCLIHLIRDLNDDLMKEPFNEELKALTSNFADLLKSIVATIDRFGLKARFLRKHKKDVNRFFKNLSEREYQTEVSLKWQKRFEKNRYKLFTFLDYDGVPWNNNNAEHAIKSVALLRRELGGVSTEKGIREYLILLSVCETCRIYGISFLDFLLSGQNDIDIYINSKIESPNTVRPPHWNVPPFL